MHHRRIAIAFLLSLALPVATSYVCLQWRKWHIKQTVKQQLLATVPPEDCALITVHRASETSTLRWEEAGEFEYRGQMYDVVKQYVKGDSLYLWCVWDHAESRLQRQLAQLSARLFEQDIPGQQQREQLSLFFKLLYGPPALNWQLFPPDQRSLPPAGPMPYMAGRRPATELPPPKMVLA